MPGGDGTGPRGMGSMTGRGVGFCSGNDVPGYTVNVPGGMRQRGSNNWGTFRGGGGRGRRNWYYATGLTGWQRAAVNPPAWGGNFNVPEPVDDVRDVETLKQQANNMENILEGINKRIEKLEANKNK